ncbi:sensor histidine kinase [Chryseolinea lacunae]|uniref:Histidine kinase n=1 Tax=Chryseolinea lacunae TaxID=2801331 RepID=A0ABS1KQ71_9BACT|nr:histidine kinase [Chryseolinea lacunae]MBL0740842.1 histidine kinase [Chryseolinea lacunae]
MSLFTTLIYSNRPAVRIARHVLFWVTDIANYLLIVSVNTEINAVEVNKILFRIPLIALAAYFFIYYLIPKYSRERDKGQLFLWIIGMMIYLGVGVRFYRYYILGPLLDPNQVLDFDVWDFRRVLSEILQSMVVISMAIAIKLIKNKTELQQKNEALVEEKKTAELGFLKAQMHPHFLFNTLNTLYSETIQDSGKAQQVVLHLSNLLRFMLDECQKPLIPIQHEIKVVRDFIALEELRHGARLHVKLVVEDINPHMMLSPLIFLPFVENSFKHTLSHKRGQIAIDIVIRGEGDTLRLRIANDKEEPTFHRNGHKRGHGISNIRRQLELLYGKTYSLEVDDSQDQYVVSLSIPSLQSVAYA